MIPLVSVIIPTYKRGQLLRRAIESALAQTYKALELIIVENGESREGEQVVRKFLSRESRLRYLYEPVGNPALARNIGIQAAQGMYIAFLDNDDEWLPNKLERQIKVLEQYPDVGLVSCCAWYITENGGLISEGRDDIEGPVSLAALVTNGCLMDSLSGVLIRRECFKQVGLFDTAYRVADDYDLYLRVAKRYRIFFLKELLFPAEPPSPRGG